MSTKSKFDELMNDTKHLETLSKEMEKDKKQNYGADPRYWKPEVDKAGNGYAVIRFLPISAKDWGKLSKPYVRMFSHGFQGPTGQWYIENSRTTLDESDPVSEYNSALWATKSEDKQKIARDQKRKLDYIANILVLKDEKHPENEGKVFLYKFGAKIYEKLEAAQKPQFPDDPKFNPFHFLEGANFKLKIRNGDGGYRTYAASEFEKPAPLFDGDKERLSALWDMEHSVLDEVAPDKFKSYDQLKKRLEIVLGTIEAPRSGSAATVTNPNNVDIEDSDEVPFDPPYTNIKTGIVTPAKPKVVAGGEKIAEGDDPMDIFRKLAS